jgi:hypothetical protein
MELLMFQTIQQTKRHITAILPEDQIRGLGITCKEGAQGSVAVLSVQPNSLASRQPIATKEQLKAGDSITALLTEKGQRIPVNSPRALAKALEQNSDGFKLEVIDTQKHRREVYFPDLKPASTFGVTARQSECEKLYSSIFDQGLRPAGKAVEVIALRGDFAAETLKIKHGDRVVAMKVGREYYDIQTPKDFELAIGNMIPGKPVSVIVARYNEKEHLWQAKTLSAAAPTLSSQLPRVGGVAARL